MRTVHSIPLGKFTVNELPGERGATVLVEPDRVRAVTDAGVTVLSRVESGGAVRTVFVLVRPGDTAALLSPAEFELWLRRHRGAAPGTSVYVVRHMSAGRMFPVEITTMYGSGTPTLMPYVPDYGDPQEQHAILSSRGGMPVCAALTN